MSAELRRKCRKVSFFFSSRRRHTRWPRDWSSDVCSSDLTRALVDAGADMVALPAAWLAGPLKERSEERRVGKECRSRWAARKWKLTTVYSVEAWPRVK